MSTWICKELQIRFIAPLQRSRHAAITAHRVKSTRLHSVQSVQDHLPVAVQRAALTGRKLTKVAQEIWAPFICKGDTVVDATAGNGSDTLFLAQSVGPQGTVYAFDKQVSAISSTKQKLADELPHSAVPSMIYRDCCHSSMQDTVGAGSASLVCFNLGYFPNSDHNKAETVTQSDTTVAAIEAATSVVKNGGLISILAYIGHPGGQEEYEAVIRFVQELPSAKYICSQQRLVNRPTAPILLLIAVKE